MSSLRMQQIAHFLDVSGFGGSSLDPLVGDASFRRYIRVRRNSQCAMLMDAPPEKEPVGPFMRIADFLHRQGFSAPAILAGDVRQGFLLLEDLGDDSYSRVLARAESGDAARLEHELYAAAVDVLARWHVMPPMSASRQSPLLPRYDDVLLLKEVSLFADWYLPQQLGIERAAALRGEYMGLWQDILAQACLSVDTFVHRDYHADNLMWLPQRSGVARVGLLDFQDGVYGDPAYDMVSLLEDARRDVPASLGEAMIDRYLAATGIAPALFHKAYAVMGAQRNSKIIGIFVRLATRDGKRHYLDYLPRVWAHLERDLAHPLLAPLAKWVAGYIPAHGRAQVRLAYTAQELARTS